MILRASSLSTVALLAAYLLTGGGPNASPVATQPKTLTRTVSPAPASPQVSKPRPVVMGYYAQFSPGDTSAQDSLARNRQRLTSVAPLWYTLSAAGELVRRGYDRSPVFAVADPAGLPVLALVTNSGMNDSVVTDPQARDRAVEAVFRLVRDNRLAGVNIDFEGLEPSSRASLVAFMKQLYSRLKPKGYLVTMAVGARRSDNASDNDFVAAYDYAALAPWVDYLVLMTYDQHWQTGAPGPIAAHWWVEEVVEYAVARVGRSKLLLGLAGYGYDWGSDGSSAVVHAAEAEALAARHDARIRWDDEASEATFTYSRNGVRHAVWFENSYSVEQRLRLVDKYRLGGVALWRLGQEEERLWRVVDLFRGGR